MLFSYFCLHFFTVSCLSASPYLLFFSCCLFPFCLVVCLLFVCLLIDYYYGLYHNFAFLLLFGLVCFPLLFVCFFCLSVLIVCSSLIAFSHFVCLLIVCFLFVYLLFDLFFVLFYRGFSK